MENTINQILTYLQEQRGFDCIFKGEVLFGNFPMNSIGKKIIVLVLLFIL